MDFDKINTSTRTVISVMNINIDIKKLFEKIEIVPYNFPSSKRGRRKKNDTECIINNVPDGSIINAKYENIEKGTFPKNKKQTGRYFRNTLSITMMCDGKLINFKIFTSQSGKGTKTQHPGCRKDEMVVKPIMYIYKLIKDTSIYEFIGTKKDLVMLLHTVMTNINFNLGFNVSRQNLNKYMNKFEKYNSMLETNIGHAGTNITIPVNPIMKIKEIPKYTIDNYYNINHQMVPFEEYVECLSDKQKQVLEKKVKRNTFLVFYSGKTIMSGYIIEHMKSSYEDFIKDIYSIKHLIQES